MVAFKREPTGENQKKDPEKKAENFLLQPIGIFYVHTVTSKIMEIIYEVPVT